MMFAILSLFTHYALFYSHHFQQQEMDRLATVSRQQTDDLYTPCMRCLLKVMVGDMMCMCTAVQLIICSTRSYSPVFDYAQALMVQKWVCDIARIFNTHSTVHPPHTCIGTHIHTCTPTYVQSPYTQARRRSAAGRWNPTWRRRKPCSGKLAHWVRKLCVYCVWCVCSVVGNLLRFWIL